jgi:eukaryotic-like serine/threonine-protein kinase
MSADNPKLGKRELFLRTTSEARFVFDMDGNYLAGPKPAFGKRAFEGASPASVIAAILERPAPSIADIAPPALDRVLKACLAKDPDERWPTARDLRRELEWVASGSHEPATVSSAAPRRSLLPWIATALATVVAALFGFGYYRGARDVERPLMRFADQLETEISLNTAGGPAVAISPDGLRLAYVAEDADRLTHLAVRLLENPKSTMLAPTASERLAGAVR